MGGLATLDALKERGYNASLDLDELVVKGPVPVPEDLRRKIVSDKAAVKAAVLLSDPPEWLAKLFDLYWSGHETPVKLTWPKEAGTQARLDFGDSEEPSLPYPENLRGGKTEVFMVSVSIKNICAAVAAEIGAPVLEWERIRSEVEEALGNWEGGELDVRFGWPYSSEALRASP